MSKLKIVSINILLFSFIAGFGFFIVHSIMPDKKNNQSCENNAIPSLSPYKKTNFFDATSNVRCFDIYDNTIYVALSDKVSVFDIKGKELYNFKINANIRDIMVNETSIFLLYPTNIVLYNFNREKIIEWNACSENSDFCSFTATNDYFFVTDIANKHICQFDKQGYLVRFIKSPENFIIPGFAFDIININDTIYCSNSGKHKVESYTVNGKYLGSFGVSGTKAGAFAGCCNPVYLGKNSKGEILTSEKGNPRISCYGKDGTFRSVLIDCNMPEKGNEAYQICVSDEKVFIASGKTVSEYSLDVRCVEKSCEKL